MTVFTSINEYVYTFFPIGIRCQKNISTWNKKQLESCKFQKIITSGILPPCRSSLKPSVADLFCLCLKRVGKRIMEEGAVTLRQLVSISNIFCLLICAFLVCFCICYHQKVKRTTLNVHLMWPNCSIPEIIHPIKHFLKALTYWGISQQFSNFI